MSELEPTAVVALLQDVPAKNLSRGMVGTIVEILAPGVFEIEFSDSEGRCYALAALKQEALLELHYGPAGHAAA